MCKVLLVCGALMGGYGYISGKEAVWGAVLRRGWVFVGILDAWPRLISTDTMNLGCRLNDNEGIPHLHFWRAAPRLSNRKGRDAEAGGKATQSLSCPPSPKQYRGPPYFRFFALPLFAICRETPVMFLRYWSRF